MKRLSQHTNPRTRLGLTVLEVMFALAIVLVGMVGIAAMVPFASRQAASSYNIAHGLAAGDNTLALFNSHSITTPSLNLPWQLIDDYYNQGNPRSQSVFPLSAPLGDSNQGAVVSFGKLYEGDRTNGVYYSLYQYHYDLLSSLPHDRVRAAIAQNRALSTSFCIDPLFWGQQTKVPLSGAKLYERDWGNFRRTRFPFYHETIPTSMDPFSDYSSNPTFSSPRLTRISIRDPQFLAMNRGWLRLPASIRLATSGSGDLAQPSIEKDKSLGPIRSFTANQLRGASSVPVTGETIVQGAASLSQQSWLATLTPSENTAVVTPSSLPAGLYDAPPNNPPNPPNVPSMKFYPESYDLAVVVFSKRDTRELVIEDYPTFAANGVTPTSERLTRVMGFGPESRTSGTFDIALNADSKTSAKIRVGDWLMLSRYVYDDPTNLATTFAIRDTHKWYRIISVSGDEVFPRRVRVAGAPWDWTLPEIEVFKKAGFTAATVPALDPTNPNTPMVATLLSDVINVFQRTITVTNQ